MKLGDFSSLATAYSTSRPTYCPEVVDEILELIKRETLDFKIIDVGAGTGIWTRMLSKKTGKQILAIEPNEDMLNQGVIDSEGYSIEWRQGSAENLPIQDSSVQWVTMASSFHWANFEKSISEFSRVLMPGGYFTAVWNPRFFESNPKLVRVEEWIDQHLTTPRVSSGRSGITSKLTQMLEESEFIQKVAYIEGKHKQPMSRELYITAWRSTNDIQVKLGPKLFEELIDFIKDLFAPNEVIETEYWTRSWTAKFV
jgi:ubiquinone/menaquinone biosynthesis C-methylase UbiE